MEVRVNIITDFTAGCLTHFLWLPPLPIPTPAPTVSIEIPMFQLATVGFAVGQNKWANAAQPVMHKGFWICLDGHNQGMLIPDITIPFTNAWYAIMWPFSSRKIVFSASTVQMNGTPTACSQLVGLPPIPQMSCGEPISAPVDWSFITITNTVSVGMTLGDLLIGLAYCAASMLLDFVLSKVFPPGAMNAFWPGVLEQFLNKLLPFKDAGETIKRGVGALIDFGASALRGNPTFKLVVLGNPDGGPVGAEVEANFGDVPPGDYPWYTAGGHVTARGNLLGQQWATQGSENSWGTPVSPPSPPAPAPST